MFVIFLVIHNCHMVYTPGDTSEEYNVLFIKFLNLCHYMCYDVSAVGVNTV